MPGKQVVTTLLLFFMVLASRTTVAETATPRETILLTAFEPFGGRAHNLSFAVAQEAQRLLSRTWSHRFDFEICQLPVVYDEAAAQAEQCFTHLSVKPRVVLSLGEGDCDLRLETVAHNLDSATFPDNRGNVRRNQPILPGAAAAVGFHFPVPAIYCALSAVDRKRVRVSTTLGSYVCNNTAFHLTEKFDPATVEYGFIHVPPAQCGGTASDVGVNARIVARLILAALFVDSDPMVDFPLPNGTNSYRLPATAGELEAMIATVRRAGGDSCYLEFLQKMRVGL